MSRSLRWIFTGIILGILVGVPWAYAVWRHQTFRNFHLVEDGKLYRSGQLSLDGLKRVVHDHGIKTVITLRFAPSADRPAPDQAEEDYCNGAHLNHFRLYERAWAGTNENGEKAVPTAENVKKFLEIVSDPKNQPVLVHCYAGIHRTGALCAIYRMEFDHWTSEEAMREMREMGYTAYHRDVFAYLQNYRPTGRQ